MHLIPEIVIRLYCDSSSGWLVELASPFHPTIKRPFKPPVHISEIPSLLSLAENSVIAARVRDTQGKRDLSGSHQASGNSIDPNFLKLLGIRLFSSLFEGPIYEAFLHDIDQAQTPEFKGIRIRLSISADDLEGQLLALLPWELLYHKEAESFLCRNPSLPLSRRIETKRIHRFLNFSAPIELLFITSAPINTQPILEDAELDQVRKLLSQRQGVGIKLIALRHVTSASIRSVLRNSSPQILHFSGHGDSTDEPLLLLESATGMSHNHNAVVLRDLFRMARSLRLVFLNACRTAAPARGNGVSASKSLASTLISAGIPAVLAMQFPISDQAAVQFCAAFYQALFDGSSIDVAVAEARIAISQELPNSWEWITPALFFNAAVDLSFPNTDALVALKEAKEQQPIAFISYDTRDLSQVQIVARIFRDSGFSTWLRDENLTPGDSASDTAKSAIFNCSLFIACLSTHTQQAGVLQKEIRIALGVVDLKPSGSLYFVPLLLEACPVPRALNQMSPLKAYGPKWESTLASIFKQFRVRIATQEEANEKTSE